MRLWVVGLKHAHGLTDEKQSGSSRQCLHLQPTLLVCRHRFSWATSNSMRGLGYAAWGCFKKKMPNHQYYLSISPRNGLRPPRKWCRNRRWGVSTHIFSIALVHGFVPALPQFRPQWQWHDRGGRGIFWREKRRRLCWLIGVFSQKWGTKTTERNMYNRHWQHNGLYLSRT